MKYLLESYKFHMLWVFNNMEDENPWTKEILADEAVEPISNLHRIA